jgi:hypothetical protein
MTAFHAGFLIRELGCEFALRYERNTMHKRSALRKYCHYSIKFLLKTVRSNQSVKAKNSLLFYENSMFDEKFIIKPSWRRQ